EEALNGAIFAEGTVQDREDDVNTQGRGGFELAAGGLGEAFGLRLGKGAGEESFGVVSLQPAALLGDADLDDVVLFTVDGVKDGVGGAERDFVLAALAAEKNADAEFLFHVFL